MLNNTAAKRRIAVLVSGGGTNLQALLDAEARGELPSGAISLVVSSKEGAYALTRARNAGVETAVLSKVKGESPAVYGQRLVSLLAGHSIHMVVLAGFLLILDSCVIRAYPGRILNIHPSLIPAFCGEGFYGLRVHEAALARGVKVTGATVHLVNEIPDGGPILAQKAVEVRDGDTPESLQRRVMEEAEWLLLPRETERLAKRLRDEEDAEGRGAVALSAVHFNQRRAADKGSFGKGTGGLSAEGGSDPQVGSETSGQGPRRLSDLYTEGD